MLYIVATPIGNLGDLTERAKSVLCSVPLVLCEDTRHSRKLLDTIGSQARTDSFHAHTNPTKLESVLSQLTSGLDIALITDAGTPGISDPGAVLVDLAHQNGIPVSPIPGPSSVTAALSVCGFSSDHFIFYGFLPKKKGRQTLITSLLDQKMTSVFFESPERFHKTVADFNAILGNERRICICRELTKRFEEVWVGALGEALQRDMLAKGEFVLVVEGARKI